MKFEKQMKRFDIAIRVMKRVKENHYAFNMSSWQMHNGSSRAREMMLRDGRKSTEKEVAECGSVCCLGGWLAVSKEFIDAGGTSDKLLGAPVYKDLEGGCAIAKFLGISKQDGETLTYTSVDWSSEIWYGKVQHAVTIDDVINALYRMKIKYAAQHAIRNDTMLGCYLQESS